MKSIIFIFLVIISASLYWFSPWHKIQKEANFRVEKLSRGDVIKNISANGTLNPVVLVNVGTQISGVINKLNVDFNDRVHKDQVLAEIDPALINAQLAQSQANLASAQASLKLAQVNQQRSKQLYAQDYIAKVELDQAEQVLAAAKAQVNAAQGLLKRDETNRDYTIIKSPVSGVVVSRNIDIGQTVAASFQTPTLFTIAQDLKQMQIDSSVAEADVGGVRIGQLVNFSVDAYPDKLFQGKVRRVRLDSKVLQNVVTYDVVIEVNNPDEILLPGMTAFVNIVIEQKSNRLKLPLAAFKFHLEGDDNSKTNKLVYKRVNNQAIPVAVEIGMREAKYAELISGDLKEGDELILEDLNQSKSDKNKDANQGNFRVKAF